jgi:uncharacterized protein YwqG
MVVLAIKDPIVFYPVPWTKRPSEMEVGQSYLRSIGAHPDQPETGSASIPVEVIYGQLDGVEDIYFIAGEPYKARLTDANFQDTSGHVIKVIFPDVFAHGLEYSLSDIAIAGAGILGLTEEDKASLALPEGQRALLKLLGELYLPDRLEEVLNLARPCLLIHPTEEPLNQESFFNRSAQPPSEGVPPLDMEGKPLFLLASLRMNEFPDVLPLPKKGGHLSFYVKITGTEQGWPGQAGNFQVQLRPESPSWQPALKDQVNFTTEAFLDLPKKDHSLINQLKWSAETLQRYDALRNLLRGLLLDDFTWSTELNKLFGYPDGVQASVDYEAEHAHHSRPYEEISDSDAAQWSLLLQVSPYCHRFPFFGQFGDGNLYFMIREKDLHRAEFDHVQLIVQST